MKISVLNGSPKGNLSVSMQYFKFIRKNFPYFDYTVFNVGNEITKIEKDRNTFSAIMDEIEESEAVFWVTPVYYLLVPSQLKRFIELIFENEAEKYFKNKYATALTTSIHFFDHTTHDYLNAICNDLNMEYRDGFSAEMNDLLIPGNRVQLLKFAAGFFRTVEENRPCEIKYAPISHNRIDYIPGKLEAVSKTGDKQIVLLTDAETNDVNLCQMIEAFLKFTPNPVEVINLNELDIKGGCLGCITCGHDNTCVYRDDIRSVHENNFQSADAVVFAGRIRDRYLSAQFKKFFDRSFFLGHCPVLKDKKTGFILSGPLRQIPNLRQVMEAQMEIWGSDLIGFVTDEYESSEEITSLINNFSRDLVWAVESDFVRSKTYWGVSSRKFLRDFVYSFRFLFRADDIFYKKQGFYDFPQKQLRQRLQNRIILLLLKIPFFRRKYQQQINKTMVKPFEELVQE